MTDFLYKFQAEDVEKLVHRRGCLIANEMGTGKTYQAIALDLQRREEVGEHADKPLTLVIAPLSTLESVWADKYTELAPHLKVYVINPKARGKFIRAVKDKSADVFVCHWESLRLMPELRNEYWRHVIADEAHRAKNRKTKQTKALWSLRAGYRTALTGTPVTNKPQDLWAILKWLYPRDWGSYWRYYEKFVDYTIEYPHGYHKIQGPKNEKLLLSMIDDYYVRHLKKQRCCAHHPRGVMEQLPEKYYDRIWVDLEPKQRRAYDQMKKDMIAWLETQDGTKPLPAPVVVAQLIRLQQLAAGYAEIVPSSQGSLKGTEALLGGTVRLTEPSSKVSALMQMLEDNPDEPIVVFSSFKQVIGLIEARLQRAGIKYVRITGDDPATTRGRSIDNFQNGSVNVFLGTIGAGGEGITLTRSSTVIFMDRDWSPAKNAQAEDRLHRGGQKNAVQVIDIMARDTVDLGKAQKLDIKKDWIRRILGDS